MTTITAVELRKNMGEIFRRVRAGEQIAVTYRDLPPIVLRSKHAGRKRKTLAGLDAFLAAPKKPSPFDPDKSFKKVYHEHLDEKYGNYAK